MDYLNSIPSTPLEIHHSNSHQISSISSMSMSEEDEGGHGEGGGGGGFGGDAAMMGSVFEDAWGSGWSGSLNQPITTTTNTTTSSSSSSTHQPITSFSFPSTQPSYLPYPTNTNTNTNPSSHILPTHPNHHHHHHQIPSSMPTTTLFGGLNSITSTSPQFRVISDDDDEDEDEDDDDVRVADDGNVDDDNNDNDEDNDEDNDDDDDDDDDDDEIMPFSFNETSSSSSPFISVSSTSYGGTSRRLSLMSDDSDLRVVGGGVGVGSGSVGSVGAGEGELEEERPMKRARWDGDGNNTGAGGKGTRKGKSLMRGKKSTAAVTTTATTTTTTGATAATATTAATVTTATSATSAAASGNLLAPPPPPKRPWNTSPQSTHLPSGSQLINPLTNELDLKPELLQGLTKEEIRKVKNRASAQRSRTRKWEVQEGLKGENERLREELERLRNEMEGNEEEESSGGGGGGGGGNGGGKDEEKEGLKALVEKLRKEVGQERKARLKVEAEVWSLKAQLESAMAAASAASAAAAAAAAATSTTSKQNIIIGIPSPATTAEDEIMSIQGVDDRTDVHGTAEKGELRRDRGLVQSNKTRAVGKDGKGVLMMVSCRGFFFSFPSRLIPYLIRYNCNLLLFPNPSLSSLSPTTGRSILIRTLHTPTSSSNFLLPNLPPTQFQLNPSLRTTSPRPRSSSLL